MKGLKLAVSLAVVLAGITAAAAQQFPSKPVTLVVGFAPGGPTDTVGRVLADRMRASLGENVVVENQAGAAGVIALGRVARADPDGHTLYIGNWTANVGSVAAMSINFDPIKDFEPVSLLTISKLWVVARVDLPASNGRELVAWLKANPGKSNAASVGVGSAAHVCLVDLKNRTGTDFQFVTYRGGAPAVQALAAGEADIACLEGGQTLGLLHGGKIKAIGVASASRWTGAPEVPTLAEGGVPGVELDFWHGMWAPKGTPKPVIDKLNAAVVEALADPKSKERFAAVGHVIPPRADLTPEKLAAYHKAEIDKWWPIIRAAGIKAPGN